MHKEASKFIAHAAKLHYLPKNTNMHAIHGKRSSFSGIFMKFAARIQQAC